MYNRFLDIDKFIIVGLWVTYDIWTIVVFVLDSGLWLDKYVSRFDLKGPIGWFRLVGY